MPKFHDFSLERMKDVISVISTNDVRDVSQALITSETTSQALMTSETTSQALMTSDKIAAL